MNNNAGCLKFSSVLFRKTKASLDYLFYCDKEHHYDVTKRYRPSIKRITYC